MLNKYLNIKALILTVLTFLIIIVFSQIPLNLTFLDPIGQAFSDFDVYDIIYSKLKTEEPVDTNIVLVNIGILGRKEIAQEIKIINRYKPKVIAIDALFLSPKDSETDSLLSKSFSECSNLVLTSKLDNYNYGIYDTLLTAIYDFSKFAVTGFANLPNDEATGYRTIRNYKPFSKTKIGEVPSFASKIVEIYDNKSFLELKKRNAAFEEINYRGNLNKFYALDVDQILDQNMDLSFIKNKIVLMGYLGIDFNTKTFDDIFFTPLNERYAGKSFPDMYGVVIHANIISMILNHKYIISMPLWFAIIIAVIASYVNINFFLFLKRKIKDWFGQLTKLILFFQSIGSLALSLLSYYYFSYRISLTLAIVAIFLTNTSIELGENYVSKIKIFRDHFEKA